MLEQLDELKDLQQRLVTSQTHKGSIRLPQHKEEFVALLEKAVIGQVLTDHCLRAFFFYSLHLIIESYSMSFYASVPPATTLGISLNYVLVLLRSYPLRIVYNIIL